MLRIEQLDWRAGRFRLKIDEWSVQKGQYLVLVGPSGAGKTVLLQTIAGLNRSAQGRIFIAGQEVTRQPPERRGIGFVYQDYWLFPHLTVRDNINFGRRYHRVKTPEHHLQTDVLAEMLNISELLERRPTTLSGGERQRVALARALAIRPRLLFLDEPLGTLDPMTREHVAAQLKTCHERFGITTIHVTHDHGEARLLGDAAAVILQGRLEQSGPTEEVFDRPRTVALAHFLGYENLHPVQAVATAQAGSVSIKLGHRQLTVSSDRTGSLTACVPSEMVRIAPGSGPLNGSLPGIIKEVSRRGPMIRLVVDVDQRNWVSLISRSEQAERPVNVDDHVHVRIQPQAWHLIP